MSFKNFDFVGKSRFFYVLSIVITVLGLVFLLTRGLNYGVDFQSGSNVDISLSKPLTTEQINTVLKDAGIGEDASVTPGNDRVNIRFSEVLTEDQDQKLRSGIEKLDEKATFEINTVDPEMAKELGRNAIYAVLISCIGIIIYVSIRFEWRFAIAAIVALLHDAFVVISIFSILGLEVDLTFIIAVLTIIGYSINDTIVIFDRIRENLRFAKIKRVSDLRIWSTKVCRRRSDARSIRPCPYSSLHSSCFSWAASRSRCSRWPFVSVWHSARILRSLSQVRCGFFLKAAM